MTGSILSNIAHTADKPDVARCPRLKFVLDAEIVVPADNAFSFDALLQRIHPASSRIRRLSVETPAILITFDLLVGADVCSPTNHSTNAGDTWRNKAPRQCRLDQLKKRKNPKLMALLV